MLNYFEKTINDISKVIEENPNGYNARKKYAIGVAGIGKSLYSGTKLLYSQVLFEYFPRMFTLKG